MGYDLGEASVVKYHGASTEELAATKADHGCSGTFCYDCDLGPDN